jgi:hypothetical protein
MSLILQGSTSGSVTLQEPAIAGTTVITLPAVSGTLPIIKIGVTQTGAVATGTTQIPSDDTIPQNTEGDQYMTLAFTPNSATSTLIIQVTIQVSSSAGGGRMTAALFQDSIANGLAASCQGFETAGKPMVIPFTYYMTAGTTSSTTFKVRVGANTAGTTTFNGSSSARLYGGIYSSSIIITEIAT